MKFMMVCHLGFNTAETKELSEYYHLNLNDKVKQMYDGYKKLIEQGFIETNF